MRISPCSASWSSTSAPDRAAFSLSEGDHIRPRRADVPPTAAVRLGGAERCRLHRTGRARKHMRFPGSKPIGAWRNGGARALGARGCGFESHRPDHLRGARASSPDLASPRTRRHQIPPFPDRTAALRGSACPWVMGGPRRACCGARMPGVDAARSSVTADGTVSTAEWRALLPPGHRRNDGWASGLDRAPRSR